MLWIALVSLSLAGTRFVRRCDPAQRLPKHPPNNSDFLLPRSISAFVRCDRFVEAS
jgi:hypothetical protein